MQEEKKKIQVEINREELINLPPASITPYIILTLRKKGIPVNGLLLFDGVEYGTLSQAENFENNSYLFTWIN